MALFVPRFCNARFRRKYRPSVAFQAFCPRNRCVEVTAGWTRPRSIPTTSAVDCTTGGATVTTTCNHQVPSGLQSKSAVATGHPAYLAAESGTVNGTDIRPATVETRTVCVAQDRV